MFAPISPTTSSVDSVTSADVPSSAGPPDPASFADPIANDPITEIRLLVNLASGMGQAVDAQA